jgi:hypothetical protein
MLVQDPLVCVRDADAILPICRFVGWSNQTADSSVSSNCENDPDNVIVYITTPRICAF